MSTNRTAKQSISFSDPPIVQAMFSKASWAWVWLAVRFYLGYAWFTSGFGKLDNPAWMQTGSALQGFWERAVMVPDAPARPAIAFDWYRTFIQFLLDGGHYTWFAPLVSIGELLVGVALILGAFTGIAAFFGGFMNWNFMMAGAASTNPLLFTISILLILAWKNAGWFGFDRFLLPLLGTPWRPGRIFSPEKERKRSDPESINGEA
ncbi:MAG: DoxX family protein [Anaerolineales bacterium]|nr:DoxX family protein [Anaerolineales bacterium]